MDVSDIKTNRDAIEFVNYLVETYYPKDVEYVAGIIFEDLILSANQDNTKIDRLIQYLERLETIDNNTLLLLLELESNVKLGKNNKGM